MKRGCRNWLLTIAAVYAISLAAACGTKSYHAAVVVDQTLAQAVFAVDDAQWKACHELHTAPADLCARLDPAVKTALLDVKALTAALQATPKDAPLPKSLPALLQSLSTVRGIVDALGTGPTFSSLAAKVNTANNAAVALLSQFVGAQ